MAALERIPPQLEAPSGERESPETVEEERERAEPRPNASGAQEGARRPWWRKMFGRYVSNGSTFPRFSMK